MIKIHRVSNLSIKIMVRCNASWVWFSVLVVGLWCHHEWREKRKVNKLISNKTIFLIKFI